MYKAKKKGANQQQTEKFSLSLFYDNYNHTDVRKMIHQRFYWPPFSQLLCFSLNVSTTVCVTAEATNTCESVQKVNGYTTVNYFRVLTRETSGRQRSEQAAVFTFCQS